MPVANNPAGRLHALLSAAGRDNHKTPIKDVWAKVLGVPAKEHTRLLYSIADVMKLPLKVEEMVRQYLSRDEQELYLRWKPALRAAFTVGLELPWSQFTQHLKPQVMESLEHCDNRLKTLVREPIIGENALLELRESVDRLLDEVRSADIDEHLRRVIMEHLAKVAGAIRRHPIDGAVPIRDAAAATVVVIYGTPPEKMTTDTGTIVNNVLKIARVVLAASNLVFGAAKWLEAPLQKYLEGEVVSEADPTADAPEDDDDESEH